MGRVVLVFVTVTSVAIFFLFTPLGAISSADNASALYESIEETKKELRATEKAVEDIKEKVQSIEKSY